MIDNVKIAVNPNHCMHAFSRDFSYIFFVIQWQKDPNRNPVSAIALPYTLLFLPLSLSSPKISYILSAKGAWYMPSQSVFI